MESFKPKLESSQELLNFLTSHEKAAAIRAKTYRMLFMFCEEIKKVDVFLARLYASEILSQDPHELWQLYGDPVRRVTHALHAVKKLDALDQVVLALDRSGNEEIIEALLQIAKGCENMAEEASSSVSGIARANAVSSAIMQPLCKVPSGQDLHPVVVVKLDGTAIISKETNVDTETQHFESNFEGKPQFSPSPNIKAETAQMKEAPTHIYMAGDAVRAVSLETFEMRVISTTDAACGIAFDGKEKKIYICFLSFIHRMDIDGSNLELIYSSSECQFFRGLVMDPTSRNLYVTTEFGSIVMFNTSVTPLSPVKIASNLGKLDGNPALDIKTRTLYFTTSDPPRLWRVGLDGKNLLALACDEQRSPTSITIDEENARVYWANMVGDTITSCDLNGKNFTAINLPPRSGPFGIACVKGRIYWWNAFSSSLQSCDMSGQDLRTHCTGKGYMCNLIPVHAK